MPKIFVSYYNHKISRTLLLIEWVSEIAVLYIITDKISMLIL
jgi:hypothetical protein